MIGLAPVKEQVRSIAASIEAARLRAEAGYTTERPMRHFVFLGPPGTGKTTVARILAKIFYAFGLLETPVRGRGAAGRPGRRVPRRDRDQDQRAGRLARSAACCSSTRPTAWSTPGDGQPDRFGDEAVQTLLKRAEDDRDRLIIILAGYEQEMDAFLSTNPGLATRFATRVRFPSYSPDELLEITELLAAAPRRRGSAPTPRPCCSRRFEDVDRRGLVDELGNGRFVRSLVEAAAPGPRRAGGGRGRHADHRGPGHDHAPPT